jgi:CheY-like chemotaxis protein
VLVNAMATLAQECAMPPVLADPEAGRTVLVVEDDRFVRDAACEVLRESGFGVIAAESAASAQGCFFFDAERVDAVLCDEMLPDGSGVELCRRLVAEDPAVRVILASGYPLQPFAPTFEEVAEICPTPATALSTRAPWNLHRRRNEHALAA